MSILSTEERRHLILSVGTHRGTRPLSPVEVARLVQRLLDTGMSPAEAAEQLQFDGTTMIGRFQRLLQLSPELQHLVAFGSAAGTIGFTHAFELARLHSPADQAELAKVLLERGLSSSEVRQTVQLRLRSHRSIAACISEVVGMRPRVEIRHMYVGAILDLPLRRRLEVLTQLHRDQLLAGILETRHGGLRVTVGKLGTDRFTLVGGDELGRADHDSLERNINAELLQRSK